MRTDPGSGGHIMFPDFCQSVLLAFGQRTHISHDHHSRGQCCSSASISYDVPCMGVISYQKTFASALNWYCTPQASTAMGAWNLSGRPPAAVALRCTPCRSMLKL